MTHAYRYLLAVLMLSLMQVASAQAQPAWRPFRLGLIYGYTTGTTGTFTPTTHLLRLDSAYTTAAGDSAWTFNRLLRPIDGNAINSSSFISARKSRNNLFGSRLIWQPGTKEFVLENVAEGNYQAAFALRLRPQAAVGSTWPASVAPALTATLTSRTWEPIASTAGSPSDSVATITLSSGQVLRLSRRYGLLAAPRWLATNGSVPQWTVSQLPATLADSPLYPATLFNLQPGDQLGYEELPFTLGMPCYIKHILRKIQTRQIVNDSLLYTYRQQSSTLTYFSGCQSPGTAGTVISPVSTGRLAFSLRTGQSPQYLALPLLSGEYKYLMGGPAQFRVVVVGTGITVASGAGVGCRASNTSIKYQQMYPRISGNEILYGLVSDGGWFQLFGPQIGLGDLYTYETSLTYHVRNTPGGTSSTCGSPLAFANLLPNRAAQAAAVATLHPNPATEAATLTLATSARPGTTLRLTDALGRAVWTGPVPAGQTGVRVPLAGQPAGLYLLHLSSPTTTTTWKLTHE